MLINKDLGEKILKSLGDKKVITIGENHGVNQNPLFLKKLIQLIGIKKIGLVAFEYPVFMEKFDGQDFDMLLNDGRISKKHIEVINWLREQGIKVVYIDPAIGDWNTRDKKMAENFEAAIRKYSKNYQLAIVIMGNLHTVTEKLKIDGVEYIPFGSHLKNQLTIDLKYINGSYFNRELREFSDVPDPKKQFEETSTGFNFYIKRATPTKR